MEQRDKLIETIGQMGRWQACVCLVVFLIKFPSAWYQLAIIFLSPNVAFQCVDTRTSNTTTFDSVCVDNCSRYVYDQSTFENTIVSEWDLVCDLAWLRNLAQTLFMAGLLVGSPVFGFLSDRLGRRRSFLAALVLLIIFGITNSFTPSYAVFGVFRFVVGFASAGVMVTSYVLCVELVGPGYREVVGTLYQIPFVLGNATLPLFAYYFRSWNTLTLALTLPSLLMLVYFWMLPESPRWLIANNKIDEATKLIENILKRNNREKMDVQGKVREMFEEMESRKRSSEEVNYHQLFRGSLLVKTLCSCVLWFVCGLFFFGVSQHMSQTSDDIFVSVAVSGAVQIPSVLLTILLTKWFGKKHSIIVSLTMSGVSMFIMAFVSLPVAWDWVIRALTMFGISVSFCIAYLYTAEVYPTPVRNMGVGLAVMMSRVGSMSAPFLTSLPAAPWLSPALFALSAFLGALVCVFLPDTREPPLQDVLD